MDPSRLIPGDATLIENIVNYLKARGIFDEFRHECLADVDTKSSCQNLNQRIDGLSSKFLANETWNQDLNKNDLRNKLRRHIDESGMLASGADHVVEQMINPKIHPFFLPKIIDVVHQYLREQNELFSKKSEDSSTSEKTTADAPDIVTSKAKTAVSDPIADILSFSYSKAKPTAAGKSETGQLKRKKEEEDKRKEESNFEKKKDITESTESSNENVLTLALNELKSQNDKEKIIKEIKLEESELSTELTKKVAAKEEIKPEKKKADDTKLQSNEAAVTSEDIKPCVSALAKSSVSVKKEIDKNKHKSKAVDSIKAPNNSKDMKKPKKEPFDKSSDKQHKSKHSKSSKESSSPTKSISSSKSATKDEKHGLASKPKSGDSLNNKTSESSIKKSSKSDSSTKDSGDSKYKKHSEKLEKSKPSKLGDSKKERCHHDSTSVDKTAKNAQYSSSHDSSEGSYQEKTLMNASKEKPKYFSKHSRKESSEKKCNNSAKISSDKKRTKEPTKNSTKKLKIEKNSKSEYSKETAVLEEAAKISSRSNSFGSTSSVSSSSNVSKDNLTSTSEETLDKSSRDKKKKDAKERDQCHSPKTLPPPPPPPPPSGSLSLELASAEISSLDDTQSSSESEKSSNEESEALSSSNSESDSKSALLDALERYVPNASIDDIDDFYDIFLYSSSSSEFEGYDILPEKNKPVESKLDSDVSVSSVHTSDLSSYNDELSEDEFTFKEAVEPQRRKRLTLKEAQQLIQNRMALRLLSNNKGESTEDAKSVPFSKSSDQISCASSDDESSPSETRRSLRRERKVNPRYASSEYTSIFNATRESFITKHHSPTKKDQSLALSSFPEPKCKRGDSNIEKGKTTKKILEVGGTKILKESNMVKSSVDSKTRSIENYTIQAKSEECTVQRMSEKCAGQEVFRETKDHKVPKESTVQGSLEKAICEESLEKSEIQKISQGVTIQTSLEGNKSLKIPAALEFDKDRLNEILNLEGHGIKGFILVSDPLDEDMEGDSGQVSSSDEMDSIMVKEHSLQENNKSDAVTAMDSLAVQLKLKTQNNSKFNINSHSVKRKLVTGEAPPAKRSCSRSSVDSSSSESVVNENKPFNSEKQCLLDEKLLRLNNDLKGSDLTDSIKNDLFCLQRTNNNGDLLGQNEVLLNSHGKMVPEKKAKEVDKSKELNVS